jgi:hypothetical protein
VSRPTLSLCMIVKNEERFLPRCLESVRGLVDEIVVVDTGSTDATREIAETFGARVHRIDWPGIPAARNVSLDLATGDWVFILDADEVVDPRDHGRIRELTCRPDVDAFGLERRTYTRREGFYIWQPCRGQYPEIEADCPGYVRESILRLFRRDPRLSFSGVVHEDIWAALLEHGLRWKEVQVPFHHLGDAERVRSKSRYLEHTRRKVQEQPQDPEAWFQMAREFVNQGQLQDGLGALATAEATADRLGPGIVNGTFHHYYADLLFKASRFSEAAEHYRKAEQTADPADWALRLSLGVFASFRGDHDRARALIQQAIELCPEARLPRAVLGKFRAKMAELRGAAVHA